MAICRVLAVLALLVVRGASIQASSLVQQPPPQPPPAMEGFEPLSEVPPSEQIPAFRLVAIAYAVVWIVLIGYVWSVSQRLQKVERELATLERKRP
jgi:CcmD family protein